MRGDAEGGAHGGGDGGWHEGGIEARGRRWDGLDGPDGLDGHGPRWMEHVAIGLKAPSPSHRLGSFGRVGRP